MTSDDVIFCYLRALVLAGDLLGVVFAFTARGVAPLALVTAGGGRGELSARARRGVALIALVRAGGL
jgi:hypothetical protein